MPSCEATALLTLLLSVATLYLCAGQVATASNAVPIKMLEEPRSSQLQHQQPLVQQAQPVKPVPAKPPSGPVSLVAGLFGRCFTAVIGHYEYRLCPFDNATQRDVAYHVMAGFHGVIGVWDGWHIDTRNSNESRLVAMAMPNGFPCSAGGGEFSAGLVSRPRLRQTLVRLLCANSTRLVSVVESSQCHYDMLLATPLACPQETALLAYPCLTERHRAAWDAVLTMRHRGLLNESSYQLLLDNLLFRANFLADTRNASNAAESTAESPLRQEPEAAPEVQSALSQNKLSDAALVQQLVALRKHLEQQRQRHRQP